MGVAMSIASTVDYALTLTDVEFSILRHQHSSTSAESAHKADVAESQLAKAVALKDDLGPLLAVMPASRQLDLAKLRGLLRRPQLRFMTEAELGTVFFDCEEGAVPPIGPDYRVPTVVDRTLMKKDDIYFEAGDHEELVHVDKTGFRKLLRGVEYMEFSNAAG
jgi:Ala-tRNA(Pro) deacylase